MTDEPAAKDTTSSAFFEAMYRRSDDPWNFATSPYELGRYEATLRALEGRQFRRALEPGCSIGVLTERLAAMCGHVDAFDIAPTAVEKARDRCRYLPNVAVSQGALPESVPYEIFDLIVLSEIGYYMDAESLSLLSTTLAGRLVSGGTLLAAHWLGHSPDHRLSGDDVHAVLNGNAQLRNTLSERHECFRLDRWMKA